MKYSDGKDVRLGDRVSLNGEQGIVVFSVDADEYSIDFPRKDWAYLKKGVMVKTDKGALVHLTDSNNIAFLA